jgi:hypothetical protein
VAHFTRRPPDRSLFCVINGRTAVARGPRPGHVRVAARRRQGRRAPTRNCTTRSLAGCSGPVRSATSTPPCGPARKAWVSHGAGRGPRSGSDRSVRASGRRARRPPVGHLTRHAGEHWGRWPAGGFHRRLRPRRLSVPVWPVQPPPLRCRRNRGCSEKQRVEALEERDVPSLVTLRRRRHPFSPGTGASRPTHVSILRPVASGARESCRRPPRGLSAPPVARERRTRMGVARHGMMALRGPRGGGAGR